MDQATLQPASPLPTVADPTDDVLRLLEEWHLRTLAEAEALRLQDWSAVRACQQSKAHLQTMLTPALQANSEPGFKRWQPIVEKILALENRNRDSLAAQKASLEARRTELDGTARNLRRVRSSYSNLTACHWQSYG